MSFASLQLSLSRHGKAEWELRKGYEPPELLEMDLTPGIRSETWRTAQLADGPEGTNVSYTNMGLMVLAPGAFIILGLLIWAQRTYSGYVEA